MPSLRSVTPLLLVVVVPAVTVPVAAAGAVAPATVLTVNGGPSESSPLDRATAEVRDGDLVVQQQTPEEDAISVTEDVTGLGIRLDVAPPAGGSRLDLGLLRTSSGEVDVLLDSYDGCQGTDGTVDVLDLQRDEDGWLTSLAVDYEVGCSDGPAVSGQLRWRSTEAYRFTATDFPEVLYATADVPVRATAVLTNRGSGPETYGETTFESVAGEPDPLTPDVVEDGCDGTTLSPGQSCSLSVTVTSPDGERSAFGFLSTVDQSVRGVVHTPVLVLGARWSAQGTFVPIDPVRVLDTRDGTGGRAGMLGQQETMTFDPAAGGAVPEDGVSAVLLNVTGTEPTQPTHVRVWPSGTPRPSTSSLNLTRGQSRPNQVVVPVGADGRVALFNNTGSTHLVADVQGFYATGDGVWGGGYHPTAPTRVLDTREGSEGPLRAAEVIDVPVAVDGMDLSTVTAVDLNLTVTEPTRPGHLTAWPGYDGAPAVSNVNFVPGQTVANHAVVPVFFDGLDQPYVSVRNSNGDTHLVVDVQGWYDDGSTDDGLRFSPSTTTRVADSRTAGTRVAAGGTLVVPAASLPPAVAHVVNVTATGSTGPGHLTTWSGDGARPSTSAVNYAQAEDSPNLATVGVGADGRIAVSANSSASHVVVDHLGYFW